MSRLHRSLTVGRALLVAAGLLAAGLPTLTACAAGSEPDGGQVEVLASFYPLAFVAERVGGDRVDVELLTPPGADPHSVELSPAQVRTVGEADLVVYLSGFQAAVDQAIAERAPANVVDAADAGVLEEADDSHADDAQAAEEAATEEDADAHAGGDPHFWLDPTRLAAVGDLVAETLAGLDPEHEDGYAERADELTADLTTLDEEYTAGLADCESSVFVTTHEAFGYLAARYGLEQIAISGIEPDTEPSPARLREVAQAVEDKGVTTIFTEVLVSPKVAEVLAADLGLTTAVLDPIGGLAAPDGEDYLSIMRANLDALRSALRCA